MKNISPRTIFYSIWIIVGLIQCFFQELMADEAYYWLFSEYLDWGYLDHPPMIALMIKAGYSIFPNELGVRLFSLLLNIGSILILEHLLNAKNNIKFYTIVAALAFVNIGFVAVPDSPLVFFSLLFLLMYKRFLNEDTLKNSLILGVIIALLLYSKYNGLLVVLLSLAAYPKVMLKPSFYIVLAVSLILFIPHLYWQYTHDWITIDYHLHERDKGGSFKIINNVQYLGEMLLVMGPLVGFTLLYGAFKYQSKDTFDRIMKFNLFGLIVVLFCISFKNQVESNWNITGVIPLLYLGFNYLVTKERLMKVTQYLAIGTIVLLIGARSIIIFNLTPELQFAKDNLGWKSWAKEIKKLTGEHPVVFVNSYQQASLYSFYSGETGFAINTPEKRMNMFNYWPIEEELQHQRVFVKWPFGNPKIDTVITDKEIFAGQFCDDFFIYGQAWFDNIGKGYSTTVGDSLQLNLKLKNPLNYSFNEVDEPIRIVAFIFEDSKIISKNILNESPIIGLNKEEFTLTIPTPDHSNEFYVRLAIQSGWQQPTFASKRIPFKITP